MNKFQLDKVLESDSFHVAELELCTVRLINNAYYPWLILVPRLPDIKEIIDLDSFYQHQLMDEIADISNKIKNIFEPDKINVASLGNQVSQLHVHIIARYNNDQAWPNPVWGAPKTSYTEELKQMMFERLRTLFN